MATLEEFQSLEPPAGGSARLSNVSWDAFAGLRNQLEHRRLRMTYDRGLLEIASPSLRRERVAYLLGRLIDVWTEERGLEVQGCRTTTLERKDLERSLEPDNCYYLEHEFQVRGRDELDLAIDPPPDLAVEVDASTSSLDRLPVYEAIGVPEVWRWRQERIEVQPPYGRRLSAKRRQPDARRLSNHCSRRTAARATRQRRQRTGS